MSEQIIIIIIIIIIIKELLMLDRNTWNHFIACKLFVIRII